MAISSLALRTTVFTASTTANWEMHTDATKRVKILEWSYISAGAATALSIGLGRPQAQTGTPTSVLFQRDDFADPASVEAGAIAWTTSATVPLIFFRRWSSAATVGVGIVFTFPRGLVVPISATFVCWNTATSVAADVNCIIDE